MMAVFSLFASAMAASCPAPLGEMVEITSTPLLVEALGGNFEAGPNQEGAGEPIVGELQYRGGLMLHSHDPRFADFDLSPGFIHSRSSGCWFHWDMAYADGNVVRISNGRIGSSGYTEGFLPPSPKATPSLPGYRFAAAGNVHRDGFTWIGVWNAEGARERSRVVAFNDESHRVLAELPIRLGAIGQLPDIHSEAYHISLVGEGKPGRPVPWLQLTWPAKAVGM